MATQTAALCESQGFYEVAKELQRLIKLAAPKVTTPAEAAPIKAAAPPGLTPAQIEAIARTITLDRDPKSIGQLNKTLELPALSPADNFIQNGSAHAPAAGSRAQSTTQTMQQIARSIKSPTVESVVEAVTALPSVATP